MSNKKQLQKEYQLRFKGLENYRDKVWNILCSRFFSRHINEDATILDLGSGYGEFSNNIVAKHKFAMDLNPDGAKRLNGDINFINQDCSEKWPIKDNSLDVVFSSNFLEHLLDKSLVEKTLKHAHQSLKPGGKIVLLGPNIKHLPGEYWDFWDHYVPISDNSMREVLSLVGFDVDVKISKFLPYTMSSGGQSPMILIKTYLKFPFFWKVLGKQFFIVASKK